MKWNPNNLSEFQSATAELLEMVKDRKSAVGATMLCLIGDLGAGKTTMTQTIGKLLGINETITSPTFVIKKIYETTDLDFKNMVHMDAYRLEGEQNLEVFRLDQDFKNPNNLVIIEWPEIIRDIIPSDAIEIYIEHAGEGRVIEIK